MYPRYSSASNVTVLQLPRDAILCSTNEGKRLDDVGLTCSSENEAFE